MYVHQKEWVRTGKPLEEAKKAIVFIHGRGGTADDIIGLHRYLAVEDWAVLAPQATNRSWYPYSFMSPMEQNQPALNSALERIGEVVEGIRAKGISEKDIFFLGFSQGACLTLEYVARHARQYGGAIAFTGGLIGQDLIKTNYQGNFQEMPVLMTGGDPDPHVPVSRIAESVAIYRGLGAQVSLQIYQGKPHSIAKEELDLANRLILGSE